MPSPAFIVFVNPYAKYGDDNPPDDASMLVQRLVGAGFNPYVDARGQPFQSSVNAYCGFIVLDTGDVKLCHHYTGGKALCMQFYDSGNLDDNELWYLAAKFAPLYNLDSTTFSYDTAVDYDYLSEYTTPLQPQPTIEHSDFLGNNIRIFEDQAFIVSPTPEIGANKRDATLVE